MTTIARILLTVGIIGMLAGCKYEVIAVEGGDVTSLSDTRNCGEGNNCVFEVSSLPFSETFTAMPKAGYEFIQWHKGDRFQCGGQTTPDCVVGIGDDATGAAILALFATGYIMPIYDFVGIDTDGDGVRDELDEDDDNDGVLDVDDPCPVDPNPECGVGIDTDGDGIIDALDEDDDNDGVLDIDDPCPLDPDPDCGICETTITDVFPSEVCSLEDAVIYISGTNFTASYHGLLESSTSGLQIGLEVGVVDAQQLSALVTRTTPADTYDIVIDNQTGCRVSFESALVVEDQAGSGACHQYCGTDEHCPSNQYCDFDGAICQLDLPSGSACTRDGQCISDACILGDICQ